MLAARKASEYIIIRRLWRRSPLSTSVPAKRLKAMTATMFDSAT
jgi:hypothetical protein